MSLAHGKPIEAEEVERVTSRQFDARRFASLCNSIAWAQSGQSSASLPSFTERVNVKDRGVDARWEVDLPKDGTYASPLLGPGLNISQYKQRDVFARDRAKVFSDMSRSLRGAVADLFRETGRRPDRYVVYTNLDLLHNQKESLKEEALNGYDEIQNINVEVVGAGELSAFLNDLPHIRSAYFATNEFWTWEKAWNANTEQKIYGANVDLIGRETELQDVRSAVEDPSVRVVILSGPSYVGKTRLALEATRSRWSDTVIAVDPKSLTIGGLLALERTGRETIALIEDPDPEEADAFVNQSSGLPDLKLLITFQAAEGTPGPEFGKESRVRAIKVGGLDEQNSSKLLKAAGAKFSYSVESWVIERCGGNPGLLLLASSAKPETAEETGDFLENLALDIEKRVRRRLGKTAIECLRRLSLLTYVGVKSAREEEIRLICQALGGDVQLNRLLNELPSLEEAGIVRVRGDYAEVHPSVLANHLARAGLRGRYTELLQLFALFERSARLRFIRRLNGVGGDEVARLWEEMFAAGGPFENLHAALQNVETLTIVAAAAPERAARVFEEGLTGMGRAERLAIEGGTRRGLMWAIEELLFRKESSSAAVRCLRMLAEAENETFGNSATGVFCECFMPFHPQCPIPLWERLALLEETLLPTNSVEMRLVGIQAIEAGLEIHGAVMMHRGSGLKPFDSRPPMTWGDVFDYRERLVALLLGAAKSGEDTIAHEAMSALPHTIALFAIQGRPEKAVEVFNDLVDWVLARKTTVQVSDLVDSIRYAQSNFTVHEGKTEQEAASHFQALKEKMEALIRRIENGDFPTRLKRWAGNWSRDDHTKVTHEGEEPIYRSDFELTRLAREVLADRGLLTPELLDWLCSDEAKKAYQFFGVLGKLDEDRELLSWIENLAMKEGYERAFASYCGGLGQHSKEVVGSRLDTLAKGCDIPVGAIIEATRNVGVDVDGAQRMQFLVQEKRVEPIVALRALIYSSWSGSCSLGTLMPLLQLAAGPEFENAAELIEFLALRLQSGEQIEGDVTQLAWQCLEAGPQVNTHQAYHCDQLAANLAKEDPQRALRLLERLTRIRHPRKAWDPLERHGRAEFWNSLQTSLGPDALCAILSLALSDPIVRFKVGWSLSELIDQEKSGETLISFAAQGENQGALVAEVLDGGGRGFWPLAVKIVEMYPASDRVKAALYSGAERRGHVITGSYAAHLEKCRKEVEDVMKDCSLSPVALAWLRELEANLRAYRDKETTREIDEEINGFVNIASNPNDRDRLWAVRALVLHHKLRELLVFMPKSELLELLPSLRLGESQVAEATRRLESL